MAKKTKQTLVRARVVKHVTALATIAAVETPLALIARVAKDKEVDVEKFGKLIEMQKDIMATQAKIDFTKAFVEMVSDLPVITKGGKISGKNRAPLPYARLAEDIHRRVKPILARYGFVIRHRTEWPAAGTVRIVGVLTHKSGHSEESAFEAPADTSDYRTHVQSLGSTVSYGRRYTTIDLLNLTIQGADDDGSGSPKEPSRRRDEPAQVIPAEQRSTHADEGEKITLPQRQRLAMIVNSSARSDAEVEDWLRRVYGIENAKPTRDILRREYDAVCKAIESPGPLPERRP